MRHTILALGLLLILAIQTPVQAQNPDFKNAITAKVALLDFDSRILDKTLSFDNLNYGIEVGYFRNLNKYLNIGFPFRFAAVRFPLSESLVGVNEKTFASLDGVLQLGLFESDNFVQPYLFAGIGGFHHREAGSSTYSAHVPLGLGFDFKINRHVYVELQSEYQLAFADNRDNFTHTIGLKFMLGNKAPDEPEISDMDGDGIPDTEDDCPTLMGSASTNGCPDTDEDGIADRIDKCPNDAGLKAFDGCPDSDSDGIVDAEVRC